jgi:small-conductance mechanosensitive channel
LQQTQQREKNAQQREQLLQQPINLEQESAQQRAYNNYIRAKFEGVEWSPEQPEPPPKPEHIEDLSKIKKHLTLIRKHQ